MPKTVQALRIERWTPEGVVEQRDFPPESINCAWQGGKYVGAVTDHLIHRMPPHSNGVA
jgi:hypothetical protein